MDIKQLKYFIAIAESGTITAAAKKLGMSQPPLSAQLRLLEEELGVTLVERGARSTRLTDAGKKLYERAQSIVVLADRTAAELGEYRTGVGGTLSIGTISSSGGLLPGRKLKRFQQLYPKVSFELHEGNTYQLLELMKERVIELAVVRTPFRAEPYECISFPPEPMVAAALPGFLEGMSDSPDIGELADRPLIYYRRMEHVIMDAFEKRGIRPDVYCKSDDARTSLMWARAGLGVALVPEGIFLETEARGMEARRIAAPELTTNMVLIRDRERSSSAAAQRFIEVFSEQGRA